MLSRVTSASSSSLIRPSLGALGHDQVAHLARRVPHPDLGLGGKLDAELAEHRRGSATDRAR